MRREIWAALAALVLVVGCGGGGGGGAPLPGPGNPGPGAGPVGGDGDGDGDGNGGPQVQDPKSYWPLTVGSRWKYRTTDVKPDGSTVVSEKVVEVEAQEAKRGVSAVRVRSTQQTPFVQEVSWQRELNGLVFRVQEEDWSGDARVLLRSTSWEPATVKSVALAPALAQAFESNIRETVSYSDGARPDVKDKTFVWTLEERDLTVTTPAGTFSGVIKVKRTRVKVDSSGDTDTKDRIYWLAPGVGKVHEEGERTEELLEVDVKP